MIDLAGIPARLYQAYRRNYFLILLLLLFVSFRILALLLFRPGGFIVDTSDYDYYIKLGQLAVKGYRPNENLATAYPPIFPTLAVALYGLASRVPPWQDPRLVFHVLLGSVLLVFEAGNFLLIADIARRLANAEEETISGESEPAEPWALGATPSRTWRTLGPPLIYALLFAPVYTWLGWFECLPLFFMLLALDLLLMPRERTWAWLGSGAAAALGFLTKLTPMLLVPIAVRWLGLRLSLRAVRDEWFRPNSPGSLERPAFYLAVFAASLAGIGYLFARSNPGLFLLTLRSINERRPWETVWALAVGEYWFGYLPVDERNPAGLAGNLPTGGLPWGLLTAIYLLIYLWLYTRPYDWTRPRTLVSFSAVSLLSLFLYSRGWSPQFQVWVLAFLVLLLPNLYGIGVAIVFMVLNYAEAHVYINIFGLQSAGAWLLWGTVLLRTLLLLGLTVLFLGQIWPGPGPARRLRRTGRGLAWAAMALSVAGAVVAIPPAADLYWQRAFARHPCPEAILFLQQQPKDRPGAIATPSIEVWDNFYPWLREDYQFLVLDDYSPDGDPGRAAANKLAALAQSHGGSFWWVVRDGQPLDQSVAAGYFVSPGVHAGPGQVFGECTVTKVMQGQRTGNAAVRSR